MRASSYFEIFCFRTGESMLLVYVEMLALIMQILLSSNIKLALILLTSYIIYSVFCALHTILARHLNTPTLLFFHEGNVHVDTICDGTSFYAS